MIFAGPQVKTSVNIPIFQKKSHSKVTANPRRNWNHSKTQKLLETFVPQNPVVSLVSFRSDSAVTPGASAKAFSRGCVEVCYLYLLVGRAFRRCFWLYWLASQKHILYQSNTLRFRTSQMAHTCDILGWVNQFSWSYLPYRWARGLSMPLRERFASAKLPQRTWTLLPKTYQDHGHLVFTTAHVKQIANTLHRIKRSMSICIIYIRYFCVMHIWNVKDKIPKSCKTHFRETSTLKKNVKIASASFRDCSPVQVFDAYVQILRSEYDSTKNRNSIVLQWISCLSAVSK